MKKILVTFLFAFVVMTPQFSHAATLSDLMTKIESLQKEISDLKSQLKGQVIGGIPGGPSTPLKKGSTGPEVIALQNFLSEKGFYAGVVDGTFGTGTLTSLNAYKASIGFTSYGSSFGGSGWRVTGDPVTMYTVTTSSCKADFDSNGKVEVADYILLQENLTLTPQDEQMMFDIKVDGIVDKYDIKEWMTQYGKTNFCMSSNTTTAQWLTSISGTATTAPAPSAIPSGSDWTAELVGAPANDTWLWDYQVKSITTYTRRQMPVYDGSTAANLMWVVDPVATSSVSILAQQFSGIYDGIETKNGKYYLVQNASFTSHNGYQYEMVRKLELYKPTASENQTTSIDMAYEKVGNTLQGEIYINKKPVSSYNGVYPKFFTFFSTDAKWMMTMRVLNDGPIETTSALGVSDNNPESAYTFATIGDSRITDINIVQGSSSFNPAVAQDYYNPTTNTITLKPNNGQVVWFHLFMKPPSVFPTGFTGISETKTYGTDYAINLQRNTAVIQNGDFVPVSEQDI